MNLAPSDTDALSREQACWLWGLLSGTFGGFYLGFVDYMSTPVGVGEHEWRFQGDLGFGGKVHRTSLGKVWVSTYPEHETDEIRERLSLVNERIAVAVEEK